MPRKNKTPKHKPYRYAHQTKHKTRFQTKKQAEEAASRQMLLNPSLNLFVYRDIDGGWYLTRKDKT
ncbi:hypothetical protein GX865_00270 [Candidatus Saccharibacteria bacterium]|jgi:hypothetical protein|nr:hypothetical protein [Candidatus Saccharibacteria bacterium]